MTVKREDVVQSAVQLERDGRTFYLEAAAKSPSAPVRKMFESLADDELDHIKWIQEAMPGIDAAETANRRLYGRLRHIFADVPEAKLRQIAAVENDVKAIHVAIGKEQQSIAAYEEWAKECDDPDCRKLCSSLADIERFHRQALGNTLEYLEHTADWFMQEEHWNFEGA